MYTAFVQDLYSRRIVGWQVADHPGPKRSHVVRPSS
ncbi:hypothetical protein ACFQX6_12655 [Streptosporangium lutulentum]